MEKLVSSFWQNKKVFLTGHTGFKGAWLSLWLNKLGAKVTGYALAPTQPSLFQLAGLAKDLDSHIADIRDLHTLQKAVVAADPEIIIHMAAQPLVRASFDIPVETYATNVMGTVNLHEASRSLKNLRAFINVTTDKCYENQERAEGYREGEPLGGYDPYSNSKACSELVTSAYRQSFFNPTDYSKHHVGVASARAGNVIGGGDWATDRLIPDLMQAFLQKKPGVVRNPTAIRPWQHVLEPLGGYLTLAQKLSTSAEYASAFNFGPNESEAKPVSYIADKLVDLWGAGATYQSPPSQGPHEAQILKLNCEKAKKVLGWQPQMSLDEALEKIVSWHKAVEKNPADARNITLSQIDAFEKSLK